MFLHWRVEVEVATALYTFCNVPGWDFHHKTYVPLLCVYFFGERSGLKNDENNFSEYFYILTMFFLPSGKKKETSRRQTASAESRAWMWEKAELFRNAVENWSTYVDTFGSDDFKYLKWK